MLELIRKYPVLLCFGILSAIFSSPGQTFLVSLFIPSMREVFDMSQTEIAGLYSLATLVSAMILPTTGRVLDKLHLLLFTVGAGLLLALGCLTLSSTHTILTLFLGFLLIRNIGQGTLTMVASTTMARVFGPMRGKALGISNLGYPIGEALFPMVVSAWILAHGWRSGWLFLAALTAFFYAPAVFILLRTDPHKRAQIAIEKTMEKENAERNAFEHLREWTLSEVLRDRRFYMALFPILLTPFFFTAFFFHQVAFFAWKGWGVEKIAGGFIAFGLCRAGASFIIGPVIDRFSARRFFPVNLLPLAGGLVCFWFGRAGYWGPVYLGLAGATMGLAMTLTSALFAELYGTKWLGSIKGLLSSTLVFATSIAPVTMGLFLDSGTDPRWILAGMLGLIGLGTASALGVCREPQGPSEKT